MRKASSVGAGSLLPSATEVKNKNQESSDAAASAGTPSVPPLAIPDRSMLGAFVLDDLCRRACILPFTSAVSDLVGIHQLIAHQPDLRPFADALALIVRGEAVLLELREMLDGGDPAFDGAFDVPFPRAVREIGMLLRSARQLGLEDDTFAPALADIERGVATMERLRVYLAAL